VRFILRLLTIARVEPEKHPQDVIEVAKILKKKQINFDWKWIGDGTLFKKFQPIGMDEGVQFVGKVSEQAVRDHLGSSDLLVLTTSYEGFCIPVVEAFKQRVAVVSYDLESMRHNFGEYSVLYAKIFDPKDLAKKIELLWNNKEFRDARITVGHAIAEDYSERKVLIRLLKGLMVILRGH
jgi:glycosyltransferase involved in cell wall biosynthesis